MYKKRKKLKFEKVGMGQVRVPGYHPEVIEEGGQDSFANFIHDCLHQSGIGIGEDNYYTWDVVTKKAWFDPKEPTNFPLFEPGPGRLESPIYLFIIEQLGGKPFEWVCFAEVDDILRGCHIKSEKEWVAHYSELIKTGIIDRWKP